MIPRRAPRSRCVALARIPPRSPCFLSPVPFPLCNAKRRGYIALTNLCSRFYDSGKWPLVSMSSGSVTLLRPTNKEANRRFPARRRKLHSARATPLPSPSPRRHRHPVASLLCLVASSGKPRNGYAGLLETALSLSRGARVSPPRARSVMCTLAAPPPFLPSPMTATLP